MYVFLMCFSLCPLKYFRLTRASTDLCTEYLMRCVIEPVQMLDANVRQAHIYSSAIPRSHKVRGWWFVFHIHKSAHFSHKGVWSILYNKCISVEMLEPPRIAFAHSFVKITRQTNAIFSLQFLAIWLHSLRSVRLVWFFPSLSSFCVCCCFMSLAIFFHFCANSFMRWAAYLNKFTNTHISIALLLARDCLAVVFTILENVVLSMDIGRCQEPY